MLEFNGKSLLIIGTVTVVIGVILLFIPTTAPMMMLLLSQSFFTIGLTMGLLTIAGAMSSKIT